MRPQQRTLAVASVFCYNESMKKRMQIYILSTIVILAGTLLYFFPDLIPDLYRKVKFKIIHPKTYQECILAEGRITLGSPDTADSERCEINGKEFGPWDFLTSGINK